jgi:hypothetical protein
MAAEFSYKPVQRISGDLIDVAIACAGSSRANPGVGKNVFLTALAISGGRG